MRCVCVLIKIFVVFHKIVFINVWILVCIKYCILFTWKSIFFCSWLLCFCLLVRNYELQMGIFFSFIFVLKPAFAFSLQMFSFVRVVATLRRIFKLLKCFHRIVFLLIVCFNTNNMWHPIVFVFFVRNSFH